MVETTNKRAVKRQTSVSGATIVVVTGIICLAVGVLIGYLVWGNSARTRQAQVTALTEQLATSQAMPTSVVAVAERPELVAATPTPTGGRPVTRYDISVDDDPVFGSADGDITIIEFSDYECVFCKKWATEIWPLLQQEYGSKVRLVYRDFPLSAIHPNASPAAVAANCAGAQDKYFDMHALLFSGAQPFNKSGYQAYADQLGLDRAQFDACLEDQAMVQEVVADYEYALTLGVQSTPTFFINGVALVGAQPFAVFKEVIDLELAGELGGIPPQR